MSRTKTKLGSVSTRKLFSDRKFIVDKTFLVVFCQFKPQTFVRWQHRSQGLLGACWISKPWQSFIWSLAVGMSFLQSCHQVDYLFLNKFLFSYSMCFYSHVRMIYMINMKIKMLIYRGLLAGHGGSLPDLCPCSLLHLQGQSEGRGAATEDQPHLQETSLHQYSQASVIPSK